MVTTSRITAESLAQEVARRLETSVDDALRLLEVVSATVAELTHDGSIVELSDLFALSSNNGETATWRPVKPAPPTMPTAQPGRIAVYYASRRTDQPLVEELGRFYAERGASLICARSGAELLARLERQPAAAVLFDGQIDDWRDIVREIKCDPKTNAVPVVGLFPQSLWHAPVHALTVQPDEVLVEPVDLPDFVRTRAAELDDPFHEEHDFFTLDLRLPGKQSQRDEACNLIQEALFRAGLNEAFVRPARDALADALENAWRHGHGHDDGKVLRVRVMLDATRLAMAVADEGTGFEHEAELFRARMQLARAAESRPRRRGPATGDGGLVRMLRRVNRVDYNRVGNYIVLTKYRRG
ncbi:MAG: ATP-binding protein [Planctomycetota bacterium]|nr:ATP-binding protein [Planctomycetota bacterium]